MKTVSIILAFVISLNTVFAQDIVVQYKAGRQAVTGPAFIKLDNALAEGAYDLVDQKTRYRYPAQLVDRNTLVFISSLKPGESRTYKVIPSSMVVKSGIKVETQSNGLLVTNNNKPVFFYHTAVANPPADSPAYYKRSGFIHPLYAPDGGVLTDDFPAGHAHQHGIFMTWVNNTFRGQPVDFWNQHKKTGTVEHVEVQGIEEGQVFSRIRTKLRHVSLAHGPVLEEIWTITVYASTADHYLFDLESEQVNITHDTLYLNKYTYGGLAFRGSREWNRHDAKYFRNHWQIQTSEGKDTATANHTKAAWVDASGKVNGKMNGVTIFGDRSNFRYPQSVRVHPDMPYWCYAPVVDSGFVLVPRQVYKSRFRFFVHAGAPDKNVIEKQLINWAEGLK